MGVILELSEIHNRRKRAGLSQTELASMVGISQSHLAKIEGMKVDPSYKLVARIFDALDRTEKDECWQYMSDWILTAQKWEEVEIVESDMKKFGYSQIPVLDGELPIGMLTERRILDVKKPYKKLLAEDAMEEIVIVPKETNYSIIIPLVRQFQAVLVQDREEMVGIITSTDLIGHRKKSGR